MITEGGEGEREGEWMITEGARVYDGSVTHMGRSLFWRP